MTARANKNTEGRKRKLLLRVVLLTALSFALSLVLYLSGLLETFELKAYDHLLSFLSPTNAGDRILLVQIDQHSIDALGKEGVTWPWPRQMYAPLVEFFKEADAFFIDILFTEQSSYGLEDDTILADKIKEAGNVYLPVALTANDRALSPEDRTFFDRIALDASLPAATSYTSAVTPIDVLKGAVKAGGNVTVTPDKDGIYRRIPLIVSMDAWKVGHLTVKYLLQSGKIAVKDGALVAGDTPIPLYHGSLLLKYYKGKRPFKTVSAVTVLKEALYGGQASVEGATPLAREHFKGKIILLGTTAPGLYDLRPTPVSSVSSGVLINATILDNILHRTFICPVPGWTVVLFMFVLSLAVTRLFAGRRYLLANMAFLLLLAGLALGFTIILFKGGFAMNIIGPANALLISLIVSITYSYVTEGKERRFIKNTFSRYVDKTIVDYLLDHPYLIAPGGQKKRVTVFFADIAGFTSISERISPEETAKMLHGVLNAFTEIVIANQGVIDKYIGDCIMAFWGSPFGTDKDETNACITAIECVQALGDINRGFAKIGIPPISVRVGIHSGDAIAGNLGSDRLFDYTVIGDTVNLSSRLESVNKVFKTHIIISEETFQKTADTFCCREIGLIEVKGKEIPVRIYELMGKNSELTPEIKHLKEQYGQAMVLFYEQKLKEAKEAFEQVLNEHPKDGPAEFNKNRCLQLLNSTEPLTNKWKIIKMTVK